MTNFNDKNEDDLSSVSVEDVRDEARRGAIDVEEWFDENFKDDKSLYKIIILCYLEVKQEK